MNETSSEINEGRADGFRNRSLNINSEYVFADKADFRGYCKERVFATGHMNDKRRLNMRNS